ncbi:MAG TPA: response regulator [Actinomycetota bacterium]|nr:response regulator [Actinomycetota bacterium]
MTLAPLGKVLLVEDNEVNRLAGEEVLRTLGYEVHVVMDGAQAVRAARSGTYTFILMDCLMPEMDGYEATALIRTEPGPNALTPVIALTSLTMKGNREKCLAAGMDEYLSKPLSPAALSEALRACGLAASSPVAASGG